MTAPDWLPKVAIWAAAFANFASAWWFLLQSRESSRAWKRYTAAHHRADESLKRAVEAGERFDFNLNQLNLEYKRVEDAHAAIMGYHGKLKEWAERHQAPVLDPFARVPDNTRLH